MRDRFDAIYREEYETGIRPDEVNWVAGRDPDDRTRQICNGWKADNALAAQVLSERTGRLAAQLMGYDGVRILQDNCIWKPPGVKALGMHQDGAYLDYLDPAEMITCWIALDDTSAEAGTISFVPGSHLWPVSEEEPRRVPRPARLARARPARQPGRRGRRARAGARRRPRRRRVVPPPQHLPRLRPEHRRDHAPARAHLASPPRPRPLLGPRRRPRLLPLPQARHRRDGRVVLPGGVGGGRRPVGMAGRAHGGGGVVRMIVGVPSRARPRRAPRRADAGRGGPRSRSGPDACSSSRGPALGASLPDDAYREAGAEIAVGRRRPLRPRRHRRADRAGRGRRGAPRCARARCWSATCGRSTTRTSSRRSRAPASPPSRWRRSRASPARSGWTRSRPRRPSAATARSSWPPRRCRSSSRC